MSSLDLGWFILDQARDALEAVRIAEGTDFPLRGPAAQGLYSLGPLYYYLLAVPFWFSQDPTTAVLFINLLNLVAVYLTYRFGKSFFDARVGLIAAALYAIFPMAVVSSKALWNPGFIPFFSFLFIYALCQFLLRNSPWALVGVLVTLACSLQIHLSAVALGALLVIGIVLFRPPVSAKPTVIGVLVFLALYAPFLAYDITHGFEGIRELLAFRSVNQPLAPDLSLASLSWRAVAAPFLIPEELLGQGAGKLKLFIAIGQRVSLALLILGCLYLIWRVVSQYRSGKPMRAEVLLVLWLTIPLLTGVHLRVNWLPWYYFDNIYPAQFLIIGIFLSNLSTLALRLPRLSRTASRLASRAGYLAIALIMLAQGLFLHSFYDAVARHGTIPMTPRQLLALSAPLIAYLQEGGLETMPARYKQALTGQLLTAFQVDRQTFEHNIHGPAFEDLREDKGFFYHWLSSQGLEEGASEQPLHYLLLRQDLFPEPFTGDRTVQVGPFRIIQYRPCIRSGAWRYNMHHSPGWQARDFDDSTWHPVNLPRRGQHELFKYVITPFHNWEAADLWFRGRVDPSPAGKPLKIVVGIRYGFLLPTPTVRLYFDEAEVAAGRMISYLTQFGRNLTLLFDVPDAAQAGPSLLALQMSGGVSAFDLDIYELHPFEVLTQGERTCYALMKK